MEYLKLIQDIEYWQGVRWDRLKRWHSKYNISRETRHFFMQNEIDLIRREKQRLQDLKAKTFN